MQTHTWISSSLVVEEVEVALMVTVVMVAVVQEDLYINQTFLLSKEDFL